MTERGLLHRCWVLDHEAGQKSTYLGHEEDAFGLFYVLGHRLCLR